jgi:hypothetical protein
LETGGRLFCDQRRPRWGDGLAGAFLWFESFGYELGPDDARIVYDDLDRFAAAAAELPTVADSAGLLQGRYIDAGSRGLGKSTAACTA